MPARKQFKARFGITKPFPEFLVNAYASFLKSIRSKYCRATIICSLGNMDATTKGLVWPGYIETAVASLKDKKIVTHFFPYKNSGNHPKVIDQKAMANALIQFIETNYWKK